MTGFNPVGRSIRQASKNKRRPRKWPFTKTGTCLVAVILFSTIIGCCVVAY